jgi:hypothetical protein
VHLELNLALHGVELLVDLVIVEVVSGPFEMEPRFFNFAVAD